MVPKIPIQSHKSRTGTFLCVGENANLMSQVLKTRHYCEKPVNSMTRSKVVTRDCCH
jgi:hypothetical protein